MSITPEDLEQPERDLVIANRRQAKAPVGAAAELAALQQRIAAALALTAPPDANPHCAACYRRGWAAALRAVLE